MTNEPKTSRRQFLRTSATLAAADTIVPRHLLGGAKFVPSSEKVNIALVGAGGQGRVNLQSPFRENDAQIIAEADPIIKESYRKGWEPA